MFLKVTPFSLLIPEVLTSHFGRETFNLYQCSNPCSFMRGHFEIKMKNWLSTTEIF
jgi:hypothetical protein